MKGRRIVPLFAGVLLMAAGRARAEDGDFELWLKFFAEGGLGAGFSARIEEELRFRDDAGEFYDEETLLMVGCDVTGWLNVAAGMRLVQERKNKTVATPVKQADGTLGHVPLGDGDHYWQDEQRPTADVTLKWKVAGWRLDDRLRFEWRMKDDGKDDYMRYRNRIRVRSPWQWTRLALDPYVSWEAFVEDRDDLSGGDRFNRHRGQAGLGAGLGRNIRAGLYYALQCDRADSGWDKLHIAGIEIGACF